MTNEEEQKLNPFRLAYDGATLTFFPCTVLTSWLIT